MSVKCKLKKGDEVIVIAGKDKGKTGKITLVKTQLSKAIELAKKTLVSGNKILIAGNGGSAADAQHFAGELTCTYKNANRKAYPAVSLSNNPSAYTAWANDFDHKDYFTRQVEALGKEKDILFLISTGGGDLKKGFSINLVRAALYAIQRGIIVFSLVGKSGGELEKISKRSVKVKSDITSHIQEAHISIIHYICETLE